jgi:hypothetical protein
MKLPRFRRAPTATDLHTTGGAEEPTAEVFETENEGDGQWDGEFAEFLGGSGATSPGWLPDFLEVGPRHVAVGEELAASLVIVGWPREVFGGWLEPLTSFPARVDVSIHVEPIPTEQASGRLRRQLARFESSRYGDADAGRLADPHLDTATADAYDLAGRIARSETRLFRVGISLLVRASDAGELAELVAAVTALASSMLLDARPATYRALRGWTTALPLGIDCLGQRRTLDTDSLAAAFPFACTDLPTDPISLTAPTGVVLGRNLSGPGLVIHDRFAPTRPNYNSVCLAQSGAGKSYLTKLEVRRSLYLGIHAYVIDPEDEWAPTSAELGGTHVRLGQPGVHVNPLDLPLTPTDHHPSGGGGSRPGGAVVNGAENAGAAGADVLTRRSLYLHTVLGVLLGAPLTAAERSVADRGIHACYRNAAITHQPTTWTRPAPRLADLATTLSELGDPRGIGVELADRLEPFTTGSFSGLFTGPTTHPADPHTPLTVYSLRALPDELKPLGTLLALDATWRAVTDPTQPGRRLVVLEEAWQLLQNPAGAVFVARLARAARKRNTGLLLVTTDVADLLASELGMAVVSNAATHFLLPTSPAVADQIAATFALSDGEKNFLTSGEVGNALLLAGRRHRVAFQAMASEAEHFASTTHPAELAEQAQRAGHPSLQDPAQARPYPNPTATPVGAATVSSDEDPL